MVYKLKTKRSRRQRTGYVLLLTLVLIALATLSAFTLTQHSLRLANEAIESQRQLQRYWGPQSCKTQILDSASDLFRIVEEQHQQDLPWPSPNSLSTEIALAGSVYRIHLSDENAKLNLNELVTRLDQKSESIIRQLLGIEHEFRLPAARPVPSSQSEPFESESFFTSYGQLFDLSLSLIHI